MALTGLRSNWPRSAMNVRPRRVELAIEHMALQWAWHDAKNAAALACVLLRWATPKSAEAEPLEAADARTYVATVCDYIDAFVEDRPLNPPPNFGEPHEHVLTRLYWYAAFLGKQVAEVCAAAGRKQKTAEARAEWSGIGLAAQCATEFIRKFATNNPVIGAADGSASGTLNRIGELIAYAGKPTAEIIAHMFFWRVRDALKGKTLPPDMETDLHAAFEAAWEAGEYEFAYSLLADLDTIATP